MRFNHRHNSFDSRVPGHLAYYCKPETDPSMKARKLRLLSDTCIDICPNMLSNN